MQKLIFVSAHAGVSKKGNEYSMVRLSNGIDSFVVGKAPDVDVKGFAEGDEVECEFNIEKGFGDGLRATLIGIQ